MSFDTLSVGLQNILQNSHSYMTKWLVFIAIIFLSLYYLYVIWPNQKPTVFFSKVFARILFLAVSVGYIVAIPFLLINMDPSYSFYDFFALPLILYRILISVGLIVMAMDLFRYGIPTLLKMAGLDLKDHNANEIANALTNTKHFFKFKKYKR